MDISLGIAERPSNQPSSNAEHREVAENDVPPVAPITVNCAPSDLPENFTKQGQLDTDEANYSKPNTTSEETPPFHYELGPATQNRKLGWTRAYCLCRCCCCCSCTILLGITIFLLWAYWACIVLSKNGGEASYEPPPAHQHAALNRSAQRKIRILSYNIFLRPFYATDPQTSADDDFKDERLDTFFQNEMVDRFDVLALQEVWIACAPMRAQRLIERAKGLGFTHWFRSGCHPLKGKTSDGFLLVLSRHPLHMSEELIYEDCAKLDCLAAKGALFVRVRPFADAACDFDLINTHLQAGGRHSEVRQKQLLSLRLLLHRRGSIPDNITTAIVGDLNLNVSSEQHQKDLVDGFPEFHDVLLTDSLHFQATANFGGVATLEPTQIASKRLDYILIKPGKGIHWIPNSSMVEPFEMEKKPFTTLSDHFAVAATLAC